MSEAHAHWLWRLSAAAWLAAARHEVGSARDHLEHRRAAITHLRRGGGMALNAVLVAWAGDDPARRGPAETMWGRSYLDHLRAVADGELGPLDADAARACTELLALSPGPPALVSLGRTRGSDVIAACETAARLLTLCAVHCGMERL